MNKRININTPSLKLINATKLFLTFLLVDLFRMHLYMQSFQSIQEYSC